MAKKRIFTTGTLFFLVILAACQAAAFPRTLFSAKNIICAEEIGAYIPEKTGMNQTAREIKKIREVLSFPPNGKNTDKWKEAWKSSSVLMYRDTLVYNSIRTVLTGFPQYDTALVFSALEAAFSLYQKEFTNDARKIAAVTNVREQFALASFYFVNASSDAMKAKSEILSLLKKKFPAFSQDAQLMKLHSFLTNLLMPPPPLKDLIFNDKWGSRTVLFSFQRKNRNYPGLTIIRNGDGSLVKDKTGKLYSIQQFTRSFSNLPSCFINGNTPAGIFAFSRSDKESVIKILLPFEVSPEKFFGKPELSGQMWSKRFIFEMLPESWEDYYHIYDSYNSGLIGRRNIVIQGNTSDPELYRNTVFYPHTPSSGNLTSVVIFDKKKNKVLKNDHQILLNTLSKCKSNEGFLVILEINDKESPVTPEEVAEMIK